MLTQNPIATDVRKSIPSQYVPGLENIVAARSRLSHVEGDVGRLTIAGFPLEEIAPHATFEGWLVATAAVWDLQVARYPRNVDRDTLADLAVMEYSLPNLVGEVQALSVSLEKIYDPETLFVVIESSGVQFT